MVFLLNYIPLNQNIYVRNIKIIREISRKFSRKRKKKSSEDFEFAIVSRTQKTSTWKKINTERAQRAKMVIHITLHRQND